MDAPRVDRRQGSGWLRLQPHIWSRIFRFDPTHRPAYDRVVRCLPGVRPVCMRDSRDFHVRVRTVDGIHGYMRYMGPIGQEMHAHCRLSPPVTTWDWGRLYRTDLVRPLMEPVVVRWPWDTKSMALPREGRP